MTFSPLHAMESALSAAQKSKHPTNKIGACLFHEKWHISRTNHWIDVGQTLLRKLPKIGNASKTIHAETACILNAPAPTSGASICITDPFCPNCAKNIAEAGIKNIYIDQNGFEKDFFKRRADHFETLSMEICAHAGINVFSVDLKNKSISVILDIPKDYTPAQDSPITISNLSTPDETQFINAIQTAAEKHQRRKFALAFAKNEKGDVFCLTARAHAVIGYSFEQKNCESCALPETPPTEKYSLIQEPVNRMMMFLARENLTLCPDYFYCSQVPTAREQVNMLGAGLSRITIGDLQKSRDHFGLEAMEQLRTAGLMAYD